MITTVLPGVALAICTVTDLRTRRIPNAVTLPLAVSGLAVNLYAMGSRSVPGAVGFPSALLGLATCFGVMLLFHVLAGHGAGDVKLAAALGTWMGVEAGLLCVVHAYIVAGVVALASLALRHRPWRPALAAGAAAPPMAEAGIPLAPCFAVAWCLLQVGSVTGGLSW